MNLASVIAGMRAAGLADSQILDAIERIHQAEADKRKVSAAARTRKWRERNEAKLRDAGDAGDAGDASQPSQASQPRACVEVPTLLKEVVKEERKKEARGRTIPGDWQPKDRHFARGEAKGLRHQAVVALGERMRNWGEANRNRAIARKADWDKTFDGFIDREATGPPTNGHAAPEPTFRFEDLPDYYEAMKRAGREQ